jgi:hypothetical protein
MTTHFERAGARWALRAVLAGGCIWGCSGGGTGGSSGTATSGNGAETGSGVASGASSTTGNGISGSSGASSTSGTAGSAGGSGATGGSASSGTGASGTAGTGGGSGSSGTGASGANNAGSGSSGTSGTAASGTSGATSGSPTGDGGSSGSSATTGGTGSSGASGTSAPSGAASFGADRVVVTGLRGITAAAKSTINLHNGGQTAVTLTKLAFSGTISLAANKSGGGATYSVQTPTNQSLFQASATLPATIMPGADLPISVQMTTTGATLPAEPPGPSPYDSGSNLFTDTLTATLSSGSAVASVYGLLLVQDSAVAAPPGGFAGFTSGYESTLGQILTTLGYQVNVGAAQTDWNPNTAMVATMLSSSNPPAPNEIQTAGGNLFTKAGAGMVTMTVVARFSPQGSLDFGWYTPGGAAPTRTKVGTMQLQSDAQTSDMARMVYPPLTGLTSTGAAGSTVTFDPGSGSFGIWIYSDQQTQEFNEGGTKTNGDYDYSQDALNSPANVHRVKTFPLADATGTAIAQSYLIAVEEASNGDYQDYVFVISNVGVAP